MVFIKELSLNGDINTIDITFPATPLFYMLAPEYLGLLLELPVQYLNIGVVKQAFPLHDLGTCLNATGHDDGDMEPCYQRLAAIFLYLLTCTKKLLGALYGRGQLAPTRLFSKNMRTTLVLKARDYTYLPS